MPEAKAAALMRGEESSEGSELLFRTRASVAQLNAEVGDLTAQYITAMEAIKLRDGIRIAMAVSGRANKFLQASAPAWQSSHVISRAISCILH